jgi:hypothetical protein
VAAIRPAGAAIGRVNGWSRRSRQITANGSSSHAAFAPRTRHQWSVACSPPHSSPRMITTLEIIMPAQTSAKTRIRSQPRSQDTIAAR